MFLRGVENDWRSTARVRWSALQFGDREAITNIEYADFPIPDTDYRTLYLSESGSDPSTGILTMEPASTTSKLEYDSESTKSIASFKYTFPQRSRLIGIPKAYLYMSCDDHDDMNVFILLRKLDKEGKPLMHLCFPFHRTPYESIADIPAKEQSSTNLHMGSIGVLRASHRKIDRSKSWHENVPFHPHDTVEKVPKGEVVELEIGIWAMGVDFDEGESLSMQVSGQWPSIAEYKAFSEDRPEWERNKGVHFVHCGGQTPSRVILPFVPL